MILHLGVIDIPYAADLVKGTPVSKRALGKMRRNGTWKEPKAQTAAVVSQTTGEVAEILEEKYHVMEIFFGLQSAFIADALAESVSKAIGAIAQGADAHLLDAFGDGLGEIENDFKKFLALREMDGLYPGVPTQASLDGVSHRFKHPYAKRASRPSFIDTGLYEASFKAWVE